MVDEPVPSRSRLTLTLDSDVDPLDRGRTAPLRAHCSRPSSVPRTSVEGGLERRHLLVGAGRHAQPALRTDDPDQHPSSSRPCQTGLPVGEPAEQHEVGVGVGDLADPGRRARRRGRPGSARRASTAASSSSALARATRATAWVTADRWYGSRTTRSASTNVGRRGQVAEPTAGERERLGHGPGDGQPRVVRQQLQGARGAGAGELVVGLVDHHDPGGGVGDRPQGARARPPYRSGCSGWR